MDLVLTLGHNSSAILLQDGQVIGGYEEERLSGVKSDSSFPIRSIEALREQFKVRDLTNIYVGHWFLDANLPLANNKYWNKDILDHLFPNNEVFSLTREFTHHDSHVESAICFAGPEFTKQCTAIVADGFGSFGECLSIYRINGNSWRLVKRVFGFEKSLGMLYQYATAFMGMKMHNHEYKMLAYEVHYAQYELDAEVMDELINSITAKYVKAMLNPSLNLSDMDPVVSIEALPKVQVYINGMLTHVLKELEVSYDDTHTMRCAISYFVQSVVERVMGTIAHIFVENTNLLLVGGLFYNVKLNSLLAKRGTGRTCIMPLAGDQGAGLGVYQAYRGDLVFPDKLTWGPRNLGVFKDQVDLPPGMVVVDNMDQASEIIHKELGELGFVNLVRGAVEFGPRALCNTTTLGLPTSEVAEQINLINARTMEMPFAPVVTSEAAGRLFHDVDKIHKSLNFMIVTRDYKPGVGLAVPGAAHYYSDADVYTGRPQITSDEHLVPILDSYNGLLINTSFNFHGVPIVCTNQQIINTHVSQRETEPDILATTIIVTG